MIFNSLLSIVYAAGLLTGYYVDSWRLYPPFLIDGAFFWVLIATSILNIYPSAKVGQVKIGRLWFHHYVYGLFVSGLAAIFIIIFTSVPLLHLFITTTTNPEVNVGRFFLLGGLTLVLDDLRDVSEKHRSFLVLLKLRVHQRRKVVHLVQYVMSFLSLYLFAAVLLSVIQKPQEATPANIIFLGTLFFTCFISFGISKMKMWLQITPEQN